MKFYIETFGCTSNAGNSQDLVSALLAMGHIRSPLEEADVIIVNTCAVTEKTERKILQRLLQLSGEKLIVAGCLPVAIPKSVEGIRCRACLGLLNRSSARKIAEIYRELQDGNATTAPLGAESYPDAATRIVASQIVTPQIVSTHTVARQIVGSRIVTSPEDSISSDVRSQESLLSVVNISEGCNGSCTYCIVKKARGNLKSRSIEDVAAEVEAAVKRGASEVQLSAQDTAAYGTDIGTDLVELLKTLAEITGDFKLRLGMMNPKNTMAIRSDLLEALKSPKIYRFLHIPVQSGSDRILWSMGRRYSAQDFIQLAGYFRSAYPDITIITDVIAGFPGETEADFRETINIIDLLQPDKVNVTKFSARPGSEASRLYDMPDRIKKDRSRELTRQWQKIALKRNQQYIGSPLDVRVTEQGRDGSMKARADNYLGVVIRGRPVLGSSVRVLIEGGNAFYASGRVMSDSIANCILASMH